ncbi:hypothetical protein [Tessaracoccus coleopterorum]|uniref:hypothetical protein n=1 Tax=Tessaracoccus coleopterorum TaxID=2714950 RepID=UPI0018D43431|nr:hypothetical protein [Tessaracoccus coleopterorum]
MAAVTRVVHRSHVVPGVLCRGVVHACHVVPGVIRRRVIHTSHLVPGVLRRRVVHADGVVGVPHRSVTGTPVVSVTHGRVISRRHLVIGVRLVLHGVMTSVSHGRVVDVVFDVARSGHLLGVAGGQFVARSVLRVPVHGRNYIPPGV